MKKLLLLACALAAALTARGQGITPVTVNGTTGLVSTPAAGRVPTVLNSNTTLAIANGTIVPLTPGNLTWSNLSAGSITSAVVAGNISDETGSGALVFGTGYTLGNGTISGNLNGSVNGNFTAFNFIGVNPTAPNTTTAADGLNLVNVSSLRNYAGNTSIVLVGTIPAASGVWNSTIGNATFSGNQSGTLNLVAGTANFALASGPTRFGAGTSVTNISIALPGNNTGFWQRSTNYISAQSNGIIVAEIYPVGSTAQMSVSNLTVPFAGKALFNQVAAGDFSPGSGLRSLRLLSYPDGDAAAADSYVIGFHGNVSSTAPHSIAFGDWANVSATNTGYALAFGANSTAADRYVLAFGAFSYANATNSIAIGSFANVTTWITAGAELGSLAIGNSTRAWSSRETVVGPFAKAYQVSGGAYGIGSKSYGSHGYAFGARSIAMFQDSFAFSTNKLSGDELFIFGQPSSGHVDGYGVLENSSDNSLLMDSAERTVITSSYGGDHRVWVEARGPGAIGFGYATVTGNQVVSVTIITNGNGGFSSPPTLVFISGNAGSGATATAGIIAGSWANTTITANGTSYINTVNNLAGHDLVLRGAPGAGSSLSGNVIVELVSGGSSGNSINTGNYTAAGFYNNGTAGFNGTVNISDDLNVADTVTAVTVTETSDARDKAQVSAMTGSLAKVLALRPVTYFWNYEFAKRHQAADWRQQFGFLAQDVQKVAPELVATSPTGELSVNYGRFAPLFTGAIQTMHAQLMATWAALGALAVGNCFVLFRLLNQKPKTP